uniref:F-box/LRR-repeat protein 4 n=1 Tax=Anthurium amnicola TaxID=1678845 RepID=A0A1D1XF78_9ARAE
MEKLGDDELGHILKRVLDGQGRLYCSEVCKQWKRVEGLTRTSLRVLETETLHSFLPRFPNLATVELGKKISDLELGFVAETCPYLRTINLNARRTRGMLDFEESEGWRMDDVGDDGLCTLATRCTLLRKVSLRRRKGIGVTGVTALIEFAQNLRFLDLSWCSRITDQALKVIASANSLQELNIRGCTSITNQGLVFLATGSSSRTLKKLDLSLCDQVSDHGVTQLQHMGLEELNLSECGPGITDTAGVCIAGIPGLRKLDLSWLINLSDTTLAAVSQTCWSLVELNVTGCELITGAGIRSFSGHKTLGSIVMASCCSVSPDDVVQTVLQCESMRYVGLDKGMRAWMSAPVQEKLKSLCRVNWL